MDCATIVNRATTKNFSRELDHLIQRLAFWCWGNLLVYGGFKGIELTVAPRNRLLFSLKSANGAFDAIKKPNLGTSWQVSAN